MEINPSKELPPYTPKLPTELSPLHENQAEMVNALKKERADSEFKDMQESTQNLFNVWLDALETAQDEGEIDRMDALWAQLSLFEHIEWPAAAEAMLQRIRGFVAEDEYDEYAQYGSCDGPEITEEMHIYADTMNLRSSHADLFMEEAHNKVMSTF